MKLAIVGTSKVGYGDQADRLLEEVRTLIMKYYEEFGKKLIIVSGHSPKGGTDIFAEAIARNFGIKTEIYPPEINQWAGKNVNHKRLKGYKARNVQIARACNILYCFTLSNSDRRKGCYHCQNYKHLRSGGCWTFKNAQELKKEVHMIIVD